ncbi:uroporphyrinogen-III C-methyltransferase [Thiopseudomonas alkaliphila]|uniref:uroporphyrinogen-III C-methyltransferase n=1 Tax=Thiopseudomonas alkaliphila TaxID=1697053 RepID=UPI00069ED0AF|nr:uroporphyrinogen-III C-methyltransferase [Thiopseudomonas alkaliphila]AKX55083.1 hypothetical protein AKN90_04705 [Thiopseudomonas alkaliphila]
MSQAPNSETKPAQAPTAATASNHSSKDATGSQSTTAHTAPSAATTQSTEKSAKGLASAALVIAILGLGLGAWGLSQSNSADSTVQLQSELHSALTAIDGLNNQLAEQQSLLEQRLAALPKADALAQERQLVAHLQADQQKLAERVELALGSSRQDWRLAEAEHLLRMASLRLSALQDVSSARVLIDGADQILYSQNDPAAFAAREALAKNLTQLDSLAKLDRTGLFVRLGALRDQAKSLVSALPEFQADAPKSATKQPTRWEEWQDEMAKYVRISTETGEVLKPLLAGKSLTEVRLSLSLALEQAQWAALNGETEVYQGALKQTAAIIDEFFSAEDQPAQALRNQVQELSQQPVNQKMPDLSAAIHTLQTYIQQRAQPKAATEQEAN